MLNAAAEPRIPHDWRCIALDVTAYCNLPETSPIAKVFDVCFYDANERTYYCEATPSYFLRGLYVATELKPGADADAAESIRMDIESAGVEDSCMHCSDVDRMESKAFGEDAEEEDVREYWQGNCPF